jgi:hypothetical protein
MSWLDPRQWIIVLAFIGVSILGFKFWEHRLYSNGYDAGYSKSQAESAEAKVKLIAANALSTQSLQAAKDKLTKEKADALQELNRVSTKLANSLRNRPSRPASTGDMPSLTSNGQAANGCTAAQLFREDAEIVVRESVRADTIRIELENCYIQYDRAKALLDEIAGNPP